MSATRLSGEVHAAVVVAASAAARVLALLALLALRQAWKRSNSGM